MFKKNKSKIQESFGDKVLNFITAAILLLLIIVVGYPVFYVISASFSSSAALASGRVVFLPVEPTLRGYEFILEYKQVWIGYRNSIFYTIMGVLLTMTCDVLTAYPLSRRYFQGRNVYMKIFYATTLFGAGLIPSFIMKTSMGFFDNVWAVILQGSVSVSHMIILRTAFQSSIPGELFDAAKIDGANEFQCALKIAIPLAKATISVLTLYCIVGCWNEYFTSMIYLRDQNLYPLQLVLRPIMVAASASIDTSEMSSAAQLQASQGLDQVRYGLIVVATVPPVAAYFIVQKYFKTGVMVGSVKG